MIRQTLHGSPRAFLGLSLVMMIFVSGRFGIGACSENSPCLNCSADEVTASDSGGAADVADSTAVADTTDAYAGDLLAVDLSIPIDAHADDVPEPMDTGADTSGQDSTSQHQPDSSEPDVAEVVWVDTPLVDPFLWTLVPSGDDPWFTDKITPGAICDEDSYGGEITPFGPWLDVDTSFCSFITLTQPLLVDVPQGTTVTVRVKHDGINLGDGEYQVTLVMGADMEVVADWTQAVPAEPAVLLQSWIATRAFAAGEPVVYHIQNHGENRWSLTDCYATVPSRALK